MMTTPHRGYTLVELIVSVAIFSVVMLVATSALLTLIALDRQARATNDVVTNLTYVEDAIARSVRTGKDYSCGTSLGAGDCTSGGSALTFTDYQGQTVTFQLSNGAVQQCIAGSCAGLTDPRIQINSFRFYVTGSTRGDTVQPRVLFSISGSITVNQQPNPISFTIESSATQRLIDL